MNKNMRFGFLYSPTRETVSETLSLQGEVTVWDYFRHYLMPYMGKEEYRVTYETVNGKRYITVAFV